MVRTVVGVLGTLWCCFWALTASSLGLSLIFVLLAVVIATATGVLGK